jgi:hypothetical protein
MRSISFVYAQAENASSIAPVVSYYQILTFPNYQTHKEL